MAERRMFAKTIVLSDAFLDMPLSTRCLYFTLGMLADDEGFINSPKSIMRQCGATNDDMQILVAKKFIIPFESGVIVIKHWKIHNYIRGDRVHETKYQDEKALLAEDENNAYTICQSDVSQLVDSRYTEVRLGKDRIGKERNKGANAVCYFPDNDKLNNAFLEFIAMRKKIKKPMTDRAIEIAISNLRKLAGDNDDMAIQIIEESILHSWQSFYPLKNDRPSAKKNQFNSMSQTQDYDIDALEKELLSN